MSKLNFNLFSCACSFVRSKRDRQTKREREREKEMREEHLNVQ